MLRRLGCDQALSFRPPLSRNTQRLRWFCSVGAKVDFSKTLLLPKTSFPMRANAAQVEPKYRKRCTDDLYNWQWKRHEKEPDQYPVWVTHDGPPYANGSPHIGHSLNKILKDIVNRYKLMRGHTVSYIPGWDCHGLPIELKAIHDNELVDYQYEDTKSAIQLRKAAKKVASSAIKTQKKHFMEWGIMGEWEKPYLTLLPSYESAQIEVFYEMYKKGLIYQGVRPVHWSPSSNTALAEAELEYPESYTSLSTFCGFSILPSSIPSGLQETLAKYAVNGNRPNVRLLIWTTTPWTLPANKGVCIRRDIEYSLVKLGPKENEPEHKDLYVIASSRWEYLQESFGRSIQILEGVLPEHILGCEYEGLIHNGKVYEAEFVTASSGTGLVHTAPGHGHDDFSVLTGKYKVEPFCPVDHQGRYTSEVGSDLEGVEVLGDANGIIIDKLKQRGMFVHKHLYNHKYPHDWRTKKPVIIRTTKQWFTDLRSLIPKSVSQLEDVDMVPSNGRDRFSKLIQQREDWCISRQRCWGVPIPVFFHKETQEPLINDETIQHLRELVTKNGVDCWWSLSTAELLPPSYQDKADDYYRCFDTVDVWFDSGVSWHSVIQQKGLPKADLYLEGSDQYRGWFQSSLLTSTAVTGEAPYKRIVTHGFVLDGEGRKMSKSVGNVIDPAIILRGGEASPTPYGADILRFWVGSVDFTKDVSISYDYIQVLSEAKRKIRNTVRFMLSNINDLDSLVEYEKLPNIDKYMLAEIYRFGESVSEYYDSFEFYKVSSLLQQLCITDFSSFYFEATKDRLYADDTSSLSRRASQTVLAYALAVVTKSLAPIMCHMSEEIFENIPEATRKHLFPTAEGESEHFSIFQGGWISLPKEWDNPTLVEEWKQIKHLKDSLNLQVEQLRRDKEIRQAMEANVRIRFSPGSAIEKSLQKNQDYLHLAFNVSSVEFIPDTEMKEDKVSLQVEKSSKSKCNRCWLLLVDGEPSTECLCPRCSSVLQNNP